MRWLKAKFAICVTCYNLIRPNETLSLGVDRIEDSVNKLGGETMSKQTRVSHPIYSFLPLEVEGFESLGELALDLCCLLDHHEYWIDEPAIKEQSK